MDRLMDHGWLDGSIDNGWMDKWMGGWIRD